MKYQVEIAEYLVFRFFHKNEDFALIEGYYRFLNLFHTIETAYTVTFGSAVSAGLRRGSGKTTGVRSCTVLPFVPATSICSS